MRQGRAVLCAGAVMAGAMVVAVPAAGAEERPRARTSAGTAAKPARQPRPLPRGFVYLERVAPDIIVDMRYATARNFTGRRVPGYRANRCILAAPVARALARVQAAVARDGLVLKVYDCYRPTQAVAAFMRWAGRGGGATKYYYPRIARQRIIPLGYIARRSSHSRGTAIDLTLVRRNGPAAARKGAKPRGTSCIAPAPEPAPASLDMGTSWDCFDVKSHTRHRQITREAWANRRRLLGAMNAQGFRNYKREWWHFSMSLRQFTRLRSFPVE